MKTLKKRDKIVLLRKKKDFSDNNETYVILFSVINLFLIQ